MLNQDCDTQICFNIPLKQKNDEEGEIDFTLHNNGIGG